MELEQEVLILEAESEAQSLEHLNRYFAAFPIKSQPSRPESRQSFLWEPDIRLVIVLIASNLITLLRRHECACPSLGRPPRVGNTYLAVRYLSQFLTDVFMVIVGQSL